MISNAAFAIEAEDPTEETSMQNQLTREQITALKKADTVVFQTDFSSGPNGYFYTNTKIRAIKQTTERERKRDPFAPREREVRIPVVATLQAYKRWDSPERFRASRASKVFLYCIHHGGFRTAVSMLRAGDQITLQWKADCNNQLVQDAGLHVDELSLVIDRQLKSGRAQQFEFLLESQVSRNNIARMIRGHYESVTQAA